MENKTYTAQEMRDAAIICKENADCILEDVEAEGGCTNKPLCKADADEYSTIAAMLRQAAEMYERCEERISEFEDGGDYFGDCDRIADEFRYILHGDVQKKE